MEEGRLGVGVVGWERVGSGEGGARRCGGGLGRGSKVGEWFRGVRYLISSRLSEGL